MGESARKAGAPTLPLTPQELLTTGPGEGYTWFERNIPALTLALGLAAAPALRNWKISRPLFAGIYSHVLLGGLGFLLGKWINDIKLEQKSEKDAILMHYMSLHPEDFPPFERQRYKDLFLPWAPRR